MYSRFQIEHLTFWSAVLAFSKLVHSDGFCFTAVIRGKKTLLKTFLHAMRR